MSAIQNVTPVLEEKPPLDENGWLNFSGYFPTKPRRDFALKFIQEKSVLKLTAIQVNVGE